ncbi:MAG: hypothetical protein M1337_00460, partial [Actinobacteria bacterium]|nr:hypothetical protein [Actinomycetota bacterium]
LDMLLGAGVVKAMDLTYMGLEVYGVSNCLRREVESGRVKCVEGFADPCLTTWRRRRKKPSAFSSQPSARPLPVHGLAEG